MGSRKVIICDDESGIREALGLILGNHYEIILTESGVQCIDCLANSKDVELVLLDIKMPQLNGIDVLKVIRERHPEMKVIIVSGYQSVETAAESVRLGVCGYITKPFKREDVLATVQSVLP
jgi:DNA-binding NtrC family response regulator